MRICEANTRILRAKPQPYIDAMISNLSLPCAASTEPQTRGESNSMQGASVKQTRSVCSPRARTPTGGRSRCGFAKQIRGFSAQSLDSKRMRCLLNFSWPNPASTDPPYRGESNSAQGAGVKKTPQQRRVGRAFPPTAPSSATPKPMRSLSQNWVEESQNETAGGQHDCRR